MKKVVLSSLVVLSSVGSAFAVTAQSGVYVGGDLGWNFPSRPSNSSVAQEVATDVGGGVTADQVGVSNKNKPYVAGITLGYDYAINDNFLAGIEANYSYLGKTEYDITLPGEDGNLNIKTSTLQFLLTGTYLDQSGFNAFAKAGMAHVDESHSATAGAQSVNLYQQGDGSRTKWLPALAAGVGYMPIQNLNVALQYEHIFGSTNTNAGANESKPYSQNAVTLGVTYKFAM